MKLHRLSGRKTNDRVLKNGIVWKGKTFVVRYMNEPPRGHTKQGLYVGTFASTRLSKSAVKRNRMRRRCREALRRTTKDRKTLPTAQVLLSPRKASLECPFEDILADVEEFLKRLS
mgnify:CR=1 FL=1